MSLKIFLLLILTFFSSRVYSQQIFKDKIYNYTITLSKTKTNQFNLIISTLNRRVLNITHPALQLYFYNIDQDEYDELILIKRYPQGADTTNSLFIYKFFPSFRFCDSLQLGRYFPKFVKFNFENPYLLKVYEFDIENHFKSSIKELPFTFYSLDDCQLKIENEESFEAYESEIYYLLDQIDQLKRSFSCIDLNKKSDLQRLLACLYVNILNSGIAIKFDDVLKENYECEDLDEFYNKLKNLYE